jgi:hypothetical protein
MNPAFQKNPQESTHRADAENGLPAVPPRSRSELKAFLSASLGIRIPDVAVCADHSSPMDYLWHTWRADFAALRPKGQLSGDCVVWANRGGGKTQLAAAATLLEGLFKEDCRTRIIAGSLDQAGRMYEYLTDFVESAFPEQIEGRILKERCRFKNGAQVRLLAQSQRAVRGHHVQKLRCDETELFQEEIFSAAKFCVRSRGAIQGAVECLSTMHRPWGLMQKILADASLAGIPVFKWCLWEVIERCGPDRSCSRCPLNSDCQGKARRADGFLLIDDCIAQMRRSSRAAFETEMLCLRPNLDNAVFADFDPAVHVRPLAYDPMLPLFRSIDFGYVHPFVCLWIQVDSEGQVRVIDEYVHSRRTLAAHAEEIKRRTPGRAVQTFCDPAGKQPNDESGRTPVEVLKSCGIAVQCCPSRIENGLELIRQHLRAGDGGSRLLIASRCVRLIEAMQRYHYPERPGGPQAENPVKDGVHDHPIDALRYFFVNYFKPSGKIREVRC